MRVRHKARQTDYAVIAHEAEMQVSTGPIDRGQHVREIRDGDKLVVYTGADGKTWARFSDEFHDGRFEQRLEHRDRHLPRDALVAELTAAAYLTTTPEPLGKLLLLAIDALQADETLLNSQNATIKKLMDKAPTRAQFDEVTAKTDIVRGGPAFVELDRRHARIQELRKALKPFAEASAALEYGGTFNGQQDPSPDYPMVLDANGAEILHVGRLHDAYNAISKSGDLAEAKP